MFFEFQFKISSSIYLQSFLFDVDGRFKHSISSSTRARLFLINDLDIFNRIISKKQKYLDFYCKQTHMFLTLYQGVHKTGSLHTHCTLIRIFLSIDGH